MRALLKQSSKSTPSEYRARIVAGGMLIVMACDGSTRNAPRVPEPSPDGLALYLGVEQQDVLEGEPMWVRLEIHNAGTDSISLIPEFSPALPVVVFTLEESSGTLITIPTIRAYAVLSEEHAVIVNPGQYYGQRIDLAHFFPLKPGYSYRATARYSWRSDGAPANEHVWKGELRSNPITFTVSRR